jgi:hypothetical protein
MLVTVDAKNAAIVRCLLHGVVCCTALSAARRCLLHEANICCTTFSTLSSFGVIYKWRHRLFLTLLLPNFIKFFYFKPVMSLIDNLSKNVILFLTICNKIVNFKWNKKDEQLLIKRIKKLVQWQDNKIIFLFRKTV